MKEAEILEMKTYLLSLIWDIKNNLNEGTDLNFSEYDYNILEEIYEVLNEI